MISTRIELSLTFARQGVRSAGDRFCGRDSFSDAMVRATRPCLAAEFHAGSISRISSERVVVVPRLCAVANRSCARPYVQSEAVAIQGDR
jgi:hypothetical protein